MNMFRLAYFSLVMFSAVCGLKPPEVKIALGNIRGTHKLSDRNKTFASFEGIPYATPPLGDLRFEPPKDPMPWPGTWIADKIEQCLQYGFAAGTGFRVVGYEDCLRLNVYVPRSYPSKKDNFDVLVHIHEGAWVLGTSDIGPEYLVDKKIIIVSINYRLGVMGFLSTENEVVPGNMGLKDQVKALEWVQKYIKSFGGNPNSVTITGFSAGGSSTHFHYFSPLSKHLFHRGIAQSGLALVPWALQEAALKKARIIAEAVGCNDSSIKKLVKCLKSRPEVQLVNAIRLLYDSRIGSIPFSPLGPVVEPESGGAFMSEHPYKILKCRKVKDVPLLVTMVKNEGTLPGIRAYRMREELDNDWYELLPSYLDFNYSAPEGRKNDVSDLMRQYYLGTERISEENYQKIIDLFGHRMFIYDIEKSARLHAGAVKSPVHFARFDYLGDYTYYSVYFNITIRFNGAGHVDDTFYLYKDRGLPQGLGEKDGRVKDAYVEIIAKFTRNKFSGITKKYSWNKICEWGPLDFLKIAGPDSIEVETVKEFTPTQFWNELPLLENEKIA